MVNSTQNGPVRCCTRRQAAPTGTAEGRTRRLRTSTPKGNPHARRGPLPHGAGGARIITPGAGHAAADSAAAEALMFLIADTTGDPAAALHRGRRAGGSAGAASLATQEDAEVRLGSLWGGTNACCASLLCEPTVEWCMLRHGLIVKRAGWLAAGLGVRHARAAAPHLAP